MKRWRGTIASAALFASFCSEPAAGQDLDSLVPHAVQFARTRLNASLSALGASTTYPRSTLSDGTWHTVDQWDWTCGFFPGCLWHTLALSGDSSFAAPAVRWTTGLEAQQYNTGSHDVGFKMMCSYGNAYAFSPKEEYRRVLVQTARSLATRFNPIVGCIRSWDDISWTYAVIIDNMMNLELLFWAARNGGPDSLRDIAVSHALMTMQNHFRSDGSTYHVVSYDPATGAVNWKGTHQGYSNESVWSRGQAWAVYGYTMAFRETGDIRFLQTAESAAQYFLAHLPADHIPYWDFMAPDIPNTERDASAAAIASSGLFELSTLAEDQSRRAQYRTAAEDILTALCVPPYLSEGTPSMGILNHGVGSYPHQSEVDVSLIYGDYYFLEALRRYEALQPPPSILYTVATVPDGLDVTVDDTTYTAPRTFTWTSGSQHTISAPSPQGTAGTRHSFLRWSDGGAISHSIVVDSTHASDTATYRTDYSLSVSASPPQGGSVALSPSSADGYYASDATVELTAEPAADFEFSGWEGDATGSANPVTVQMTAPRTVTAAFAPATGLNEAYGELPSTPVLIGNFPNPFNNATVIRYAVPTRMRVTLKVYDGVGRIVANLEDADREAGFHQVRMDAVKLSSGMYYCRMSAQRPAFDRDATVTMQSGSSLSDNYMHTIPLLLVR